MAATRGKNNMERYNQLVEIFGEGKVSGAPSDQVVYARDQWIRSHLELRQGADPCLPDFVVWPETIEEIGRFLRLANEKGFPVIPVGGGAGTTGGSAPAAGSVVVDMKRMNHVLGITDENLEVVAETGILAQRLELSLNRRGYTLGHFPASFYASTLGGFLATRSSGQLSTRYGRIEDLVVALVAVLPDGSIYRSRNAPRSATGPDLDQMLLGTEGTLAILVQATLRIDKQPEIVRFRAYYFADVAGGLAAMRLVLRTGVRPAVLRLHDEAETKETLHRIYEEAEPRGCLLLLTTEGNHLMSEAEMAIAAGICADAGGKDLGEDPARRWWKRRFADEYGQSTALVGDKVRDTIEVAAPWSNVFRVYTQMRAALEPMATCRAHFAHGTPDGCSIVFTATGDPGGRSGLELYDALWQKAMTACLKAGGTISHHRGIGLAKAPWMAEELGPALRIFRDLKARLDPGNILNPGKMGLPERPVAKRKKSC